MKKYVTPDIEIVRFDMKDILSASEEEAIETTSGSTNAGSTCSPINLPCHSQSGNQPAC